METELRKHKKTDLKLDQILAEPTALVGKFKQRDSNLMSPNEPTYLMAEKNSSTRLVSRPRKIT
jgi:hypothetical protein